MECFVNIGRDIGFRRSELENTLGTKYPRPAPAGTMWETENERSTTLARFLFTELVCYAEVYPSLPYILA